VSRTLYIGLILVCVAAGVVWWVAGSRPEPSAPSRTDVTPTVPAHVPAVTVADVSRVTGRWVRADHPYVLEIVSSAEGERIEAAYHNPRPINVSIAEFREIDGTLEVFVELRDEGYPGSTYTLTYDAADDVLRGIYFQAGLRQNYDVTFVRSEPAP